MPRRVVELHVLQPSGERANAAVGVGAERERAGERGDVHGVARGVGGEVGFFERIVVHALRQQKRIHDRPEQQIAALIALAPKLPSEMSDLALAIAGYKSVDPGKLDAMASQLDGMTALDRPFRLSARELQALALVKKGDIKGARTIWEAISKDGSAPPGVSQRTAAMLALHPAPAETK